MTNVNLFRWPVFSAALLLLVSCANLKEVHRYATTAGESIRNFRDIHYSFTTSCHERCVTEQLEARRLSRTDCDCQLERQADSILHLLYSAINSYFDGLAGLSADNLTNYSFNPVAKSLSAGSFGGVQITPEQAQSYARIAGVLSGAITGGYRKKKLSVYIGEANEAVKTLLQALRFNMERNLAGRLETRKSRLRSFYFDLANDATTSAYERKNIIEEYGRLMAGIEERKQQLQTFSQALEVIAESHQKLSDNRTKLSLPQLKEMLQLYASNIRVLVNEFSKLQNQP